MRPLSGIMSNEYTVTSEAAFPALTLCVSNEPLADYIYLT